MPEIALKHGSIHYRVAGCGPLVLLVHGSCVSSNMWRPLIERMSNRYRVVAPDLHGYGRSAPWQPGNGLLLEDEAEIVAALARQQDGELHIVGHSYGGYVAAAAALDLGSRVTSLTLIEASIFALLTAAGEAAAYDEIRGMSEAVVTAFDAGQAESAADAFMNYWVGETVWAATPAEQRERIVGYMEKLCHEWRAVWNDPTPTPAEFAAITAPTCLLRGTATKHAASRVTEVLRGVLPNHTFAEMPGMAHMSPLTHPHVINPLVERHIVTHSEVG